MDLTAVAGGAAALLLRPDGVQPESGPAGRVRAAAEQVLPPPARGLLGQGTVSAGQIHGLVELLRTAAAQDTEFRGQVVDAVSTGTDAADALRELAAVSGSRGDWAAGIWCYRRCEELLYWLGHRDELARCVHDLGGLYEDRGLLAEAAACYRQSRTAFEQLGHRRRAAAATVGLDRILHRQGAGTAPGT